MKPGLLRWLLKAVAVMLPRSWRQRQQEESLALLLGLGVADRHRVPAGGVAVTHYPLTIVATAGEARP
jgi:hypothetical protein